jgi:hypothetical protein
VTTHISYGIGNALCAAKRANGEEFGLTSNPDYCDCRACLGRSLARDLDLIERSSQHARRIVRRLKELES